MISTTIFKINKAEFFINFANRRRDQSPRDRIVHVYVNERNCRRDNTER